MPFKFTHVCDLLSKLERIKTRDPPLLPKQVDLEFRRVVEYWFRQHRRDIDDPSTDDVALLSTLFPERRTDRVYGFQEARLSHLIGRALYLNSSRTRALQGWKTPGNGDLGTCVEKVLKDFDCEPKPGAFVTVEEIDNALQELASLCRFSSPEVRSTSTQSDPLTVLRIFLRLKSFEAKWFTRLLLKDFSPVILNANLILTSYHFLLPGLLRFQDNFTASIELLRGPLEQYHANPDETSQKLFKQEAAKLISPRIGIKIGRPSFFKSRSIAHCLKMVGSDKWAMERKYDGEYCEIHIDLSRGTDCIKIFSKSGKDSTEDRKAVHDTISKALQIGKPNCAFRKKCIVLGELLVYSDLERKILEFHKIRKHVSRSGLSLWTDEDSQAHKHEHLMIMFFDALLIDDENLMAEGYNTRRTALRRLVKKRPGYAMTSEWKIVDFGCDGAMEAIVYQFAAALAYRTEGLVLKPADMPYFSFDIPEDSDPRHFIKLKKDYIAELGQERDIADFAVVGASYDCQQALRLGIRGLQFTHFHLGCLANPDAIRFGHRPVYEVVAIIGDDQCIPRPELQALNDYGRSCCRPFERLGNGLKIPNEFDLLFDQTPASKLSVIFNEPCVVEVLGSGFEKPGNKSYFMLRHPRVLKLHLDRSWKDATTMEELRRMAEEARSAPVEGESQEMGRLVEKLKGKVERNVEYDRSSLTTPRTDSTVSPSSIGRRPTDHGSPISSSPSIRKKGGSSALVKVDTAKLPRGECQGTKQVKQQLQSAQSSIKDPLQILSTSSVDRSTDALDVPETMKKAITTLTVKSSQKRTLDEPSDLHPTKRCRIENSNPPPLTSSRPTLIRCSSCGKFKKPANQSRIPLADITSKQTP